MPQYLISEPAEVVLGILGILGDALDLVDIGILLLNRDMRVCFLNSRQAELFGLPAALLATRPTFRELLEQSAANGRFPVSAERLPDYLDQREAAVRAGSFPATQLDLADGQRVRFSCIACPDGSRILTYADISAELARAADDAVENMGAEMRFNSEMMANQGAHLAALAEAADENAQKVEAARRALEHEIAERCQLEVELRRLATTDNLTGILNRSGFLAGAQRAVEGAIRLRHGMAVLMLDVDHFKSINDRFGHAGGDLALQHLVAVLGAEIRASDLLGRVGGEEFAVVLSPTSPEPAERVAERLRLSVAETPLPIGDQPLNMTISLGLAFLQDGDTGIGQMILRADAALYRAKNSGRNRVVMDRQAETAIADGATRH